MSATTTAVQARNLTGIVWLVALWVAAKVGKR